MGRARWRWRRTDKAFSGEADTWGGHKAAKPTSPHEGHRLAAGRYTSLRWGSRVGKALALWVATPRHANSVAISRLARGERRRGIPGSIAVFPASCMRR